MRACVAVILLARGVLFIRWLTKISDLSDPATVPGTISKAGEGCRKALSRAKGELWGFGAISAKRFCASLTLENPGRASR